MLNKRSWPVTTESLATPLRQGGEEHKCTRGEENTPETPRLKALKAARAGSQRGGSMCAIPQPEHRHRAREGEASVTSYLSTIFHWSISELMTGRSSLILPEEDFKGSLGSKK